MHYFTTALHTHIDSGFGATADSFKEAADKLKENAVKSDFNNHLPINFLYRHAIELYLKSAIIILHRRLKIPYGTVPFNSEPMAKVGSTWELICKVHSIAALWLYLQVLFEQQSTFLKSNTKTDWTFPSDVSDWVKTIEENDPRSTYFRYPNVRNVSKDKEKSSWKEIDPDKLLDATIKSTEAGKYAKIFVEENQKGEAVRAYMYDDEALKELNNVLKQMADLFEGVHFGMRAELCGGW